MFSRIYQSAKAIFIDAIRNEKVQQPKVVELLRDETMVTTRERHSLEAVREEINDENSINVYVPSSTNKRQKRKKDGDVVILSDEDDESFTPTNAKKRKRLPVRAKDVESPDHAKTRPVVEIPAKKLSPELDHGEDTTTGNEVVFTEEQDDEMDAEVAGSLADSKHLRFESEQAEDEMFSTGRAAVAEGEKATSKTAADGRIIEDTEGSDDSDDDAPEAVGMQQAATNVKLKDRDAAKAVQHQLSVTRKKRKDRDDALKKQAESSKKRKLEDDFLGTQNFAEITSKQASLAPEERLGVGLEEGPSVLEKVSAKHQISSKVTPLGRRALPDVLPAEYLEDTEPQKVMLWDDFPPKKAKKTNFQQTAGKDPKDRRIGNTIYRITKTTSTNLAPKSSSQARNTKESWLKGRAGKSVTTNRNPFSKGFFKR